MRRTTGVLPVVGRRDGVDRAGWGTRCGRGAGCHSRSSIYAARLHLECHAAVCHWRRAALSLTDRSASSQSSGLAASSWLQQAVWCWRCWAAMTCARDAVKRRVRDPTTATSTRFGVVPPHRGTEKMHNQVDTQCGRATPLATAARSASPVLKAFRLTADGLVIQMRRSKTRQEPAARKVPD